MNVLPWQLQQVDRIHGSYVLEDFETLSCFAPEGNLGLYILLSSTGYQNRLA